MTDRLHALWHQRRLWIWAASENPPDAQPAPLPDIGSPCTLRLEGSDTDIPARCLEPVPAVHWLAKANLPESSESVRFWAKLARFTLDLLVHGRFYPDVEAASDALRTRWRPWLADPKILKWLEAMVQTMPPTRLVAQERPDPAHLVESFLLAATDALVRHSAAQDPFFHDFGERNAHAPAPPEAQWMAALLSSQGLLSGSPEFLQRLGDQVRQWVGKLEQRQTGPLRLDFVLEEPPEELQDPADAQWVVSFRLCLMDESETMVDAAELWSEEPAAVLGRNVLDRRKWLVEELRSATEAFPPLERVSDQPSEIRLNTSEAHLLLRQWSADLRQRGYGVVLPQWMARREIGLHMLVHPQQELQLLASTTGSDTASSGQEFEVGASQFGLQTLVNFDWQVAVGDLRLSVEEFQNLVQSHQSLVRYQGQWIELDEQAARKAMEHLNGHVRGTTTLAEAIRATFTAQTQAGLPVLGLSGTGWLEHLLNQTPTTQLESMTQPESFKGTLRPYQLRGLDWLSFLDRLGIGACLADDMGLGKTIQLIALLLREREGFRNDGLGEGDKARALSPRPSSLNPTLLFAPTSVVGNWRRELERFAPSLKTLVHHGPQRLHGKALAEAAQRHDVVITSYALAHRDQEDLAAVPWHRLVLDEAQKIKNPSAAATLAIRSLSAPRRVALTGTPIENHLSELWSIMEVLNPGLLGTASEFRQRFALPIERMGDVDRSERLRRLIQPFILRRTKSDPHVAAELPEKLEMRVFCNLTQEQAALYQRITDEMLTRIDAAGGIRRRGLILAALTRLKQVCNHPALIARSALGPLDGRSGKCERLVEMMEEIIEEGDTALIFTQYRQMGHLLEKILTRRLGATLQFLHGGTPAAHRDDMVEKFNAPGSDIRIFILSLRAGGVGLNLTAANHVFHFDRWWNPAIEQQATDRAHRIGQKRKVQVHKFVCAGTVEERIDQMLQKKLALAERIVGAGDEWLTNLSTEQLRDCLLLDQDTAVGDFSLD
jgi:SNF2 family DNA or RNA helicase